MRLRKSADFLFIQIFPILRDKNDNFQTLHTLQLKPEVLKY